LIFPVRKLHFISILLILFMAAARAEEYSAEKVELFTADGYRVYGTYYFMPDQNGPALLLLHMFGQDHSDWESFLPILKRGGIESVLAIDLRGHGGSNMKKAIGGKSDSIGNVDWRDFGEDDFKDIVKDLDVAWDFLKGSRSTDTTRMGVMGASIGANYAAVFASDHPDVKSLALLSPGVVYRGVECVKAVEKYGARPVLFAASEKEEYSANSCEKLKEVSAGTPAHLEILKGSAHGTNLIEDNPGFKHFLSDWFRSTL
jgi:pimeloyl-ACP methyl ester carboxylesterase